MVLTGFVKPQIPACGNRWSVLLLLRLCQPSTGSIPVPQEHFTCSLLFPIRNVQQSPVSQLAENPLYLIEVAPLWDIIQAHTSQGSQPYRHS